MTPEPNQPERRPILRFAAGTPIRTPEGYKAIEDVKPGDFIQTGPDEEQAEDRHDDPEQPRWWERN